MPHVKVYIHFVWSTKYREPFLESAELRKKLWVHIKENASLKGIYIDHISGYKDHCHCLVSLGVNQSMSNIMHLIKGESSHWINENKFCEQGFQWQNDYYAISVGESTIDKVRKYIRNQEAHHQLKSFDHEEQELTEKYGFVKYSK